MEKPRISSDIRDQAKFMGGMGPVQMESVA